MVWSPTPWPRIFHFYGIYSILDAKPHISMISPTYVGTKEYSYITSLLPILPTGPTHLPHPRGGGGNHDHGGEPWPWGGDYIHPTDGGGYIHPTPIHRGEGGNHDYLYYLQDHIHRGEGEPWPWGGGGPRTWNTYILSGKWRWFLLSRYQTLCPKVFRLNIAHMEMNWLGGWFNHQAGNVYSRHQSSPFLTKDSPGHQVR